MRAIVGRTISVRLDPFTRARLYRLAASRRITPHVILCEAVFQYVNREEKRDSFRTDTRKTWEAYRATGWHVSAGEADAWLAQLEDGKDIDPPEGHT